MLATVLFVGVFESLTDAVTILWINPPLRWINPPHTWISPPRPGLVHSGLD